MNEKINYLEYPAKDLAATKAFFEAVFSWQFIDYGAEYTAFKDQGLEGGFYKSDKASRASEGAALTVFLSEDFRGLPSAYYSCRWRYQYAYI